MTSLGKADLEQHLHDCNRVEGVALAMRTTRKAHQKRLERMVPICTIAAR